MCSKQKQEEGFLRTAWQGVLKMGKGVHRGRGESGKRFVGMIPDRLLLIGKWPKSLTTTTIRIMIPSAL